jgi:hypothetical protein
MLPVEDFFVYVLCAGRGPVDLVGLGDVHRPGPIVTAAWAVA